MLYVSNLMTLHGAPNCKLCEIQLNRPPLVAEFLQSRLPSTEMNSLMAKRYEPLDAVWDLTSDLHRNPIVEGECG